MLRRFRYHLVGKLHQGHNDIQSKFQCHLLFQQTPHHLKRQFQRVGWHLVAGVEPEIVHQNLTQLLSHESVIRQRMMVLSDAFRSPLIDTEILGAQRNKRLMLFRNKNILISRLGQVSL